MENSTYKIQQKESWEIFYLEYCDKYMEHTRAFFCYFCYMVGRNEMK